MLLCQLGFEVGIAHVRVIEVVEGWVTVTLFVEGIEAEVNELRRAVGEEKCGSALCGYRTPTLWAIGRSAIGRHSVAIG